MTKVWHAKEGVIKLDLASNITVTSAAALDSFFNSTAVTVTGVMKDISITEPMIEVDKIDLMGISANLGSNFQNAELEEKPAGMVEVTGTAILPGDEVGEQILYGTAGTAASTTRYRPGQSSVKKIAMLLNLDDSSDEVSFLGTNMVVTAHETKVTGADGHFEVTWTLKCLAKDWYGPEFKD